MQVLDIESDELTGLRRTLGEAGFEPDRVLIPAPTYAISNGTV